ncbi:MAG: hypothetical protein Q8N26_34990 [Myxococcales bacterium]|nr:hypothetical protein [Myxococcales bacterium]
MTFSRLLRLVVTSLALFLARDAHAALCFEELTDATVCGASVVEDATLCGVEKVTDATECGTKKVKDAAECGTETISDGAVCGWETLSGAVNCAGKCIGSLGAKCTCRGAAKSCKAPKSCRIAKTCEKPRSCQKPKTCTRKLASCDPFPELWRAKVIAAINLKHKDHLDKLNAVKVPEQAELASMAAENVKDLPDTLGPYLNLISAKSKRFVEALNDEKMMELIKRVIFKCANREIDGSLRNDLKELARFLRTREDRVPDIKLKLRDFSAMKATAAKGDEDEEGRVAKRKSRPPYPRVHAITLNVGVGIAANGSVSIGAVFDDEGSVAGFISGGYGFGLQGRIGADITYTMIPADSILDAGGVGIGVVGDAAYVGGVAVGVSWDVPATTAIPSWSVGPAFGMGGGAAYAYDTGYVFAPIMKK